MLEKLAGRLKWERTGNGIHVEIPVMWDLQMVGVSFWMFMFPHFLAHLFWDITHQKPSLYLFFLPDVIGLFQLLLWLMAMQNFKVSLTPTPETMTAERRAFGILPKLHTEATRDLSNLRFELTKYGLTMDQYGDVQIDLRGKTRRLAFRIRDSEVEALIKRMMEVYQFPAAAESDALVP
jgi:hypothetical protein